jgi:3-deoxy-manno-octulosonate cytidylyltransferase (CMP-KDO synthetase)
MSVIGIIPARWASKRFPGKPLAKIAGKTLIQRVWEKTKKSKLLNEIIIATADIRIKKEAEKFKAKAVLTKKANSGTERITEVIRKKKCEIVVNIQGDEPLIDPKIIDKLIICFKDKKVNVATAAAPITKREFESKHIVKVITDKNNDAIYFSREKIPNGNFHLAKKHIGIYAYRRKILLDFKRLKSKLAEAEDLEQLKFIENDVKIRVIFVKYNGIAVDTPKDIKKVLARLK